MKTELKEGGAVLRLEAETGPELDIISTLAGLKPGGGVFSQARQVRVPADQAPFVYDDKVHGVHFLPSGNLLLGLELQVAWLGYAEPPSPRARSRKNVALRLGYGLLDALELVQRQRPE